MRVAVEIVLLAGKGMTNEEIGFELGTCADRHQLYKVGGHDQTCSLRSNHPLKLTKKFFTRTVTEFFKVKLSPSDSR